MTEKKKRKLKIYIVTTNPRNNGSVQAMKVVDSWGSTETPDQTLSKAKLLYETDDDSIEVSVHETFCSFL